MSEINKKDLHNNIISGLRSTNNQTVLDSISQLRHEGKPKDLRILFDLLVSNCHPDIKTSIYKFLWDVKDQNTDKIIIEAIGEKKYNSIQKNLVEVCWESSIDFSTFLSTFVDLLIHSDFETSFEAFTVIENITEKVPDEMKPEQMTKLKNAIPNAPAEKKGIIHEAIHIIDQL